MIKKLALTIMLISMLVLSACGVRIKTAEKTGSVFFGTWKLVGASINGERYSSEGIILHDDLFSLCNAVIIIKESGILGIFNGEKDYYAEKSFSGREWHYSDYDTIITTNSSEILTYNADDDEFELQNYTRDHSKGVIYYFQKKSDSQLFSINVEKDEYADDVILLNDIKDQDDNSLSKEKIYGFWQLIAIFTNNTFFTAEETKAMGMSDSLLSMEFAFNENGTVYMKYLNSIESANWSLDDRSFIIISNSDSGEMTRMKYNREYLFVYQDSNDTSSFMAFKKTSNKQIISN